jgi:hypothetical protein
MPLKFGRKPAKFTRHSVASAAIFASHLNPLGSPPANSNDYVAAVDKALGGPNKWGMLGNDYVGDCTCADGGHQIMLHTANCGQIFVPTTQDVMTAYSAVSGYNAADPNTDEGAAESDVCKYMQTTGIAGHKSVMWAAVDPDNVTLIKWTVQLFGACRIGVSLPQSCLDQFDQGQPWTVVADDGGFAGGHDVPIVKYEGDDAYYVVTWGKVQKMDKAFLIKYADEAYVEAYPDFIQKNGVAPSGLNLNQLLVDMVQLHRGH